MTSKKPNLKSNLLTAFENSVKANPELAKGDFAAIIEAGRATCIQIDDGLNSEDEAKAKAAAYQMPYLVGILKEMYATPASRQAVGLPSAGKVGSRGALAKFTAVNGGKNAG